MALGTVTKVKAGVVGDLRYAIVDVQITSGANYTTGGETFAAAQVPGLTSQLLAVHQCGGGSNNANRVVAQWDAGNKKLMAFGQTANTDVGLIERAANVDLSAAANSVRLFCLGK